jgi:uncharacterized integral membrane protein
MTQNTTFQIFFSTLKWPLGLKVLNSKGNLKQKSVQSLKKR